MAKKHIITLEIDDEADQVYLTCHIDRANILDIVAALPEDFPEKLVAAKEMQRKNAVDVTGRSKRKRRTS